MPMITLEVVLEAMGPVLRVNIIAWEVDQTRVKVKRVKEELALARVTAQPQV